MSRASRILGLLVGSIFVLASGCGGGGGGGGGGGTGSTGVRLFHSAIDAAPLEILSSANEEAFGIGSFSNPSGYFRLAEGPQNIQLRRARTAEPALFSLPLEYIGGQRFTVLVLRAMPTADLRAVLINDGERPRPDSGSALLRLVHGVSAVGSVSGSIGGVSLVDSLGIGAASSYVTVPVGLGTLSVREVGSGAQLAILAVDLADRSVATVFARGEKGFFVSLTVADG